jgi:hypothetical protein
MEGYIPMMLSVMAAAAPPLVIIVFSSWGLACCSAALPGGDELGGIAAAAVVSESAGASRVVAGVLDVRVLIVAEEIWVIWGATAALDWEERDISVIWGAAAVLPWEVTVISVTWGAAAAFPWDEKLTVKIGWAGGCWEDTLCAAEEVESLPILGVGAIEAPEPFVGSAGCVEVGAVTVPLAADEGGTFSVSFFFFFFSSSSSSSDESESSLDDPPSADEGLLSGESGLSGPSSSSSSSSSFAGTDAMGDAALLEVGAVRRTRLGTIRMGVGRRSW